MHWAVLLQLAVTRLVFAARTVALRLQIYGDEFKGARSEERVFADYVLCNLILFLVVANFMG